MQGVHYARAQRDLQINPQYVSDDNFRDRTLAPFHNDEKNADHFFYETGPRGIFASEGTNLDCLRSTKLCQQRDIRYRVV